VREREMVKEVKKATESESALMHLVFLPCLYQAIVSLVENNLLLKTSAGRIDQKWFIKKMRT
jgi:hypothetical protein